MTSRSEPAAGQGQPAGNAFGWLVWSLAASFYGFGFFLRVSPSVMTGELMRDFAVSAAALGNLSAFYFYAYAAVQVPVGIALDRWGPHRLLTGAALATGCGCLLFGSAQSITAAETGRLLIGLGAGTSFVATLTLGTLWLPPSRAALISGLTMAVGVVGATLGQAPLAAVVEQTGWRSAMLGAAAFVLLLSLPIWLLAREPAGYRLHRTAMPLLAGLRASLTNRQVLLVALLSGTMAGPMLAFGALWGVPYLMQTYGMDRSLAAALTSTLLIGWGIGGPLNGWLSDRLRRRKAPLAVATAAALAAWIAVIVLPPLPTPALFVLLLVNGISGGGMMVVFPMVRELSPPHAGAVASGVTNTAIIGSGAVMQPLVGWLLDGGWDGTLDATGARLYDAATYHHAFLSFPLVLVLGLAATALLRETHCRPIVAQRPG